MNANDLREKFLKFFKEKNHAIIPSASLIPQNDPSVLFTTAGMHPLVPCLLGEKHPSGKRLANFQKCIRTTDIEDVGDNRHLTFFEMLGNWSLGDYFKKEAIEWSFEFLTDKKWLGLDAQRLYVTVFMGNDDSPIDQESIDIWKSCFNGAGLEADTCPCGESIAGNKKYRIFPLPAKDNWWGPAGQTGPCGPCTEMFYDVEPQKGLMKKTFDEEMGQGRIIEIWNDVFMEFTRTSQGNFEKLEQKNVDTGMGLERTSSVLSGKADAFDNELFLPIFQKIEEISGKKYSDKDNIKPFRIIADHIKSATFLLAENLEPSNVERGYILRRLIRRAVRYGKQLGVNQIFTFKVANTAVEIYKEVYPELYESRDFIEEQLIKEEEKFGKTLEKGMKEFESEKLKVKNQGEELKVISGDTAFNLYQTYGFPIELTEELAKEEGLLVDRKVFSEALVRHQELSRAGAEQKFAGGLADHSERVVKYHTAAHLMLAALRQVLGENVVQKGSNITAERLRFDFSHSQKMTAEELKKVEEIVNEKIQQDLLIKMEEMSLDEARNTGAMGVFESRYGEKVKVYTIGESDKIFSREICGGPHAERTGILGKFKIIKEEASSGGVRRIKAVLE